MAASALSSSARCLSCVTEPDLDLGKGITPEHLDASVGDLGAIGNPQVVDQHRHVRTLAHERSACPGG